MTKLSELRELASELGMELIYMIGRSKTEFEKVKYENFSPRKNVGLSRDGGLFLPPIDPNELAAKMQRAVNRQKKAAHIEKTQDQHGETPE